MPPPIKLPFSGKKLRAVRERQGLRQQDLGVLIGMPQEQLSRYENNHNVPTVTVFNALLAALNCRAADLIDETEAGAA
jgi:transcriptional regulator with XRE-family HTH domain